MVAVIRVSVCVFLFCSSLLAAELDSALGKIMAGRSGTAIVVNVASGKILGAYHRDVAAWKLARPGSALKPFTLLALIDSGKLKPADTLTCRRNLRVGSHDLSCSHPQTGQPLQAVSALAYSCNDYFASMGSRLTAEELQAIFRRFGFASPTGLLAEETTGSLQLARTDAERQLQAIGEGEMRVTPLEMLAAYRKLALYHFDAHPSEGMRTVFEGLQAGTEYGMARLAAMNDMNVAGKTGTARTDQGAWSNAWFAGYAPARAPQIAVVVFLEKGTGPGDAAPLASQIFEAFFHIWGKR
jgi:cell division protein FtsI/penicillin-binding protein 2